MDSARVAEAPMRFDTFVLNIRKKSTINTAGIKKSRIIHGGKAEKI